MDRISESSKPPAGTSIFSAKTTTQRVDGKSGDVGKEEFMKLLLAQLQNQDPMNPMDDQAFIAQVAQFNSLEQMQEVNKTLSAVLDAQQLASASGLIGKTVNATGADGKPVTGLVTAASVEGGKSMLHIGAKKVALDKVTGVATDEAGLPPAAGASSA